MSFPPGWSFERLALTVMAIGAALMMFHQVLNGPPRVLPLKERQAIVARDRAFLLEHDDLGDNGARAGESPEEAPRAAAVIGDKCSGKDCRVVSISTQPVLVANLPACNASSIAMARFVLDGALDGGGTYYECDGTGWNAIGEGGTGYTGTAPIVVTGSVISITPASALEGGYWPWVAGKLVVDAGIRLDTAAGSNAIVVNTDAHIKGNGTGVAGYLTFSSTYNGWYAQSGFTAFTYLQSIGEAALGAFPTCNATLLGTLDTDQASGCMRYCDGAAWSECFTTAASASTGGYWRNVSGLLTVDAGVKVTGVVVIVAPASGLSQAIFNAAGTSRLDHAGGTGTFSLVSLSNTLMTWSGATGIMNSAFGITTSATKDITSGAASTATTYLRSIGSVTGSLPSCVAGLAGAIQYDTTTACPKFCNGSVWSGCIWGGNTVQVTDSARDVGTISIGDCSEGMSVTGISGVVFKAGDSCDVGFARDTVGGAPDTIWTCWPSATDAISLRVCCNAGVATTCNPDSQTIFYNVVCADGDCGS